MSFRIRLIFLTLLSIGSFSGLVNAELVRNDIYFKGYVVNQPCKISQGYEDISVDLGVISTKELYANGQSKPVNFDIELSDCNPNIYHTVKVKFTGNEESKLPGHLRITGDVSGIAITLMDSDDTFLPLSQASKGTQLQVGVVPLHFSARVTALVDAVHDRSLAAGDFAATANFVLSYQ